MVPPRNFLVLRKKKNTKKLFKTSSDPLSQILEIWYVALPSGPSPDLFK